MLTETQRIGFPMVLILVSPVTLLFTLLAKFITVNKMNSVYVPNVSCCPKASVSTTANFCGSSSTTGVAGLPGVEGEAVLLGASAFSEA